MKKIFSAFLILLACGCTKQATNEIPYYDTAKFMVGDDSTWCSPSVNDQDWQDIKVTTNWDNQGIEEKTQFAWYRLHVQIPKSLLETSDLKEYVEFSLGAIDDVDATYLNGELIGKTGQFPEDDGGYVSAWSKERKYRVDVNSKAINWDQDNVIAIRCYSGNHPGGMFGSKGVKVSVPSSVDACTLTFSQPDFDKAAQCVTTLKSDAATELTGELKVELIDPETEKVITTKSQEVAISNEKPIEVALDYDKSQCLRVKATFAEKKFGRNITAKFTPKYILTPAAPATPRFNTTAIYGVRPGSPIHFRFGVSGERPMKITSADMPEGLSINPDNGALSGSLANAGDYTFTVVAENAKGKAEQKFTVRVGSKIALTPPMGWNSWNCWGLSVTQDKVVSSAKALIEKGLADYGYAYMNIDDGWEAPKRNPDGTIAVNEKFPSMKELGDWLHSEGLKFGIYSSPGNYTCGGYLGSIDHELQDAESYNSWGIDYLKYDWCGYSNKHVTEPDNQTVASYVRPYLLMERFLRQQPRDIFYSLCQYGMAEVWKWGEAVDANSWRTTGDITDTWNSMYDIGFVRQAELSPYAKPGHWNDPDMLVVGKVGWSNNLRDSRLTPDEQYTHISLWTLLASNMLIGCDLAQLDEFTIALLCNNEVNAVNQDVLGKQAKRDVEDGSIQIWSRPLSDGSRAIGIFNVGDDDLKVDFSKYLSQLGLTKLNSVRDLWRQQDLSTTNLKYYIPTHGVRYIKVN